MIENCYTCYQEPRPTLEGGEYMTVDRHSNQEIQILRHNRYGSWSEQKPGFGTLGRFHPLMTRVAADQRTVEVGMRFDRAEFILWNERGFGDNVAVDKALFCGSFSGSYNAPQLGRWTFEMKAPSNPLVELVAMLWPKDDKVWPDGEVNVVEGQVNGKKTMTNIHWKDEAGLPQHDPLDVDVDIREWHRYDVDVEPGVIAFSIDGTVVREIQSPHVAHNIPSHLVLQCGVNAAILDNFETDIRDRGFEEWILYRPIAAPGLRDLTICK